MPSISVVIPTYNAERTILETIASVQQQTYSDFELIVINDGSTDQTLELLEEVQDPRLKVCSYENGGLPVARNRGIAQATGEFIAFLDADDLWTSDKLELQLAALLQHPEAGVAYSWTHFMDEQGESFHAGEPLSFSGYVYANLLLWNFIASGSNPLIRKQAIESVGEFDPLVSGAADWDYWLRLAAKWPFVVVPKYQILYRQSSGAMSSNVVVMEKEQLIVLERAFQAASPELQHLKKQSLANIYQYLTDKCLTYTTEADDLKLAGHLLEKSIHYCPQPLLDRKVQNLVKWFIKLWILMQLQPVITKAFSVNQKLLTKIKLAINLG